MHATSSRVRIDGTDRAIRTSVSASSPRSSAQSIASRCRRRVRLRIFLLRAGLSAGASPSSLCTECERPLSWWSRWRTAGDDPVTGVHDDRLPMRSAFQVEAGRSGGAERSSEDCGSGLGAAAHLRTDPSRIKRWFASKLPQETRPPDRSHLWERPPGRDLPWRMRPSRRHWG